MGRGRILNWLSWLLSGAGTPPKPAPPPVPIDPAPVPAPGDHVAELLGEHNTLRARVGATPLVLNVPLTTAAQRHAEWMARNRDMDHVERPGTPGYSGQSFADRARAAGYGMGSGGENVAAGQQSVDAVVSAWVASDPHYHNITDVRWRDVGFGVARDDHGSLYWCTVFGASPARLTELYGPLDIPPGLDAERALYMVGPYPEPEFLAPPAVVCRGQL